MDLEIGIVCGRCESYAPLGVMRCGSCESDLSLEIGLDPPKVDEALPGEDAEEPDGDGAPDHPEPAKSSAASSERSVASTENAAGFPPSDPGKPRSEGGSSPSREYASVPAAALLQETPSAPRVDSIGAIGRSLSSSLPPLNRERTTADMASDGAPEPIAPPGFTSLSEPTNGSASNPPVSRGGRVSGQLAAVKSSKPKSVEELMDQAKNFVCRSCSTPVPMGHKFCGRCGAAVPPEIMNARTQFFGQLQAPGKAKLILIRGEGVEGLSYQLNAEQHVVGKAGQLVFPDDPFVSPRHANFFYKNGVLCVRDEGSLNGVYLRVRGTIPLTPEDHFLAGEQVFRVDGPPKLNDTPGPDGTYFYSSPKHQSPFRITQILQGGAPGMTVCARTSSLQIGREGGDLNFPTDLYMSGSHCKIEESGGNLTLTDVNSRNGTYVRLKAERELGHGDYLFIGRKLLRVEITAA